MKNLRHLGIRCKMFCFLNYDARFSSLYRYMELCVMGCSRIVVFAIQFKTIDALEKQLNFF
jgi:hypothetical protein